MAGVLQRLGAWLRGDSSAHDHEHSHGHDHDDDHPHDHEHSYEDAPAGDNAGGETEPGQK